MRPEAKILPLLFLVGHSIWRASAQPAPGPPSAAADPICGFTAGLHYYLESERISQGFAVSLLPVGTEAGKPVTLRFFAHSQPRNLPMDKLQVEHEKFMHVIGVRDDLSEFFHLHPRRVSPGIWEVTHTFPRAGTYKLWVDVKYNSISYSFGQPRLTVSGLPGSKSPPLDSTNGTVCPAHHLDLDHPEPLVTGRTNQFHFSLRDASGNRTATENYLGAPIHLVIIRDDLSVYLHAHPEPAIPGSPEVWCKQSFTSPGDYKLFAQFRPKAASLPADEALLATFSVHVASPH